MYITQLLQFPRLLLWVLILSIAWRWLESLSHWTAQHQYKKESEAPLCWLGLGKMLGYQVMLPQHLLSSPSPLCGPVMLGDTPALPGSPSQRLEWISLELEQQMFLFNVYSCTVMIPMMYWLHSVLAHAVMPPPPIISGSSQNTSFYQGLDLTFTCSITLGDVVDTPVTVQGIWNRNGAQLMDGDENGRITIVNPPMRSSPYDITLRFNPLNVTDGGTYECDATVTPEDTTFTTTATTSNSRTFNVSGT